MHHNVNSLVTRIVTEWKMFLTNDYDLIDANEQALQSPQLVQVFCRPVNSRNEAVCRRWFRAPVENTPEMQRQLAQTLDVTFSDGFVASDVS
ncbi:unnamed protein product, partial [Anisakis simplex]|uniref:DNA-directed DNA polymerase n=1 Tax=Anisakis simplex TaxID=6269 RepID=A0A0M3JDY7_ANISI